MSAEVKTIHIEPSPESGAVVVYHRDFPEIRVQGCSEIEAVTLLCHQLTRALDSALTDWRRQSLQSALNDTHCHRDSTKPG
ncbi:hypothetical protein GC170_03865 [bacterium]|nr:hypothetical protein [bacterium]